MKNNKGLTLVELIVSIAILAVVILEIFNVMTNSSVIYRNGTYDVNLQTEAQQVISQFEELAIDVNSSFSYATNSCIITNKNVTYTISLEDYVTLGMDDSGNPTGYGNMYLSSSAGGKELMAEYVERFEVDTASLKSGNKITLNLNMKRERNNGHYYTYAATKDIYLRNRVGQYETLAGDEAAKNSGGGDKTDLLYTYSLNVLRYHKYNLNELYGTYAYSLETGEFTTCCELNGSVLSTNAPHNRDYGCDREGYVVAKNPDGSLAFRIRIYCDKVQIGMGEEGCGDGYLLCYYNGNTNSTVRTSLAMFRGISADPEDIGSVKVTLVYELTGKGASSDYVDYYIDFVEDPTGKNGNASKKMSLYTSWNFFGVGTDKLERKGGEKTDEDPYYPYVKIPESEYSLKYGEFLREYKLNGTAGWVRFGAQNVAEYDAGDYEWFIPADRKERKPPNSKNNTIQFKIYSEQISENDKLEYFPTYFGDDKTRVKVKDGAGAEKEMWFRIEDSYFGFNAEANSMYAEGKLFYTNNGSYYDYIKYGNQAYILVECDYGPASEPIRIKCIPIPAGGDQSVDDRFWDSANTDGVTGHDYYKTVEAAKEEENCKKINERIIDRLKSEGLLNGGEITGEGGDSVGGGDDEDKPGDGEGGDAGDGGEGGDAGDGGEGGDAGDGGEGGDAGDGGEGGDAGDGGEGGDAGAEG